MLQLPPTSPPTNDTRKRIVSEAKFAASKLTNLTPHTLRLLRDAVPLPTMLAVATLGLRSGVATLEPSTATASTYLFNLMKELREKLAALSSISCEEEKDLLLLCTRFAEDDSLDRLNAEHKEEPSAGDANHANKRQRIQEPSPSQQRRLSISSPGVESLKSSSIYYVNSQVAMREAIQRLKKLLPPTPWPDGVILGEDTEEAPTTARDAAVATLPMSSNPRGELGLQCRCTMTATRVPSCGDMLEHQCCPLLC